MKLSEEGGALLARLYSEFKAQEQTPGRLCRFYVSTTDDYLIADLTCRVDGELTVAIRSHNCKAERLRHLIAEIYHYHAAGGCAHIVLDDDNVEDEHLDWCIEEARKLGSRTDIDEDHDDYRRRFTAQAFIEAMEILKTIPEDERIEAIDRAKRP